jgi:hypothetical protein
VNIENLELIDECNRMHETIKELNQINRKNEIAMRETLEQQEKKIEMISQMEQLNNRVSELQKNLKIIEIEKDEAFYRCEELQQKLDIQTNNFKISNRILKELERKLQTLKTKNEENEKIICFYRKVNSEEKINLEEVSQNSNYESIRSHNKHTLSTKFSSYDSKEINNSNSHITCEKFTKNNHSRSLSNLLPDIFEDETQNGFEFRISLTSNEVVRKMSDKIKIPKPNNKSNFNLNFEDKNGIYTQTKNDIYKDFFLLTYQSMKLNSKSPESFHSVNPELLYGEIIKSNIPFHEVIILFIPKIYLV